jgi:N-acetylneuraminate epimerase
VLLTAWCVLTGLPSTASSAPWSALTPLPDAFGLAAPYAGVVAGELILAGGANFPDGAPWAGGKKVWHSEVYALAEPHSDWRVLGKLPQPAAYGVSITSGDGLICIGGSDENKHSAEVFKIQLDKSTGYAVTPLPSLPMPLANSCGALVGTVIYLAGGIAEPTATSALGKFYALDLQASPLHWQELPTWPGPARMLAVAGAQDGAFYLFSGAELSPDAAGKPVRRYLNDAYRYRPASGWKPLANLPRAAVAAASPAVVQGGSLLLISGDDGKFVNFQPKSEHPGFPRTTLRYDVHLDHWSEAPSTISRATVPTVQWQGNTILPNGEVRPAVRTPEVLALPELDITRMELWKNGERAVASYRIPGVISTQRGSVLAYCEARHSGSDWGDIRLEMRRSTDGGLNWSPAQPMAEAPGPLLRNPVLGTKATALPITTYNNPVAISDDPNIVHFIYCVEYQRCFHQRSEDDGLTWSAPLEITDSAFAAFRKDFDWKVIATGPGHGLRLRSGRLVVPVWLSAGTGSSHHGNSVSASIYSDDHGKSWHAGALLANNSPEARDLNETSAAELADGSVLFNSRNHNATQRRLLSTSRDGATNWTTPAPAAELWETICFGSMLRYSEPRPAQLLPTLSRRPAPARGLHARGPYSEKLDPLPQP